MGRAGYVLPRFFNKVYHTIDQGYHFGISDFGQDPSFIDGSKSDKEMKNFDKEQLIRRFTVQALANCELLTMAVRDILKMRLEFPRIFHELFSDSPR